MALINARRYVFRANNKRDSIFGFGAIAITCTNGACELVEKTHLAQTVGIDSFSPAVYSLKSGPQTDMISQELHPCVGQAF